MYTIKRGNMISLNVIGGDRYMRLVAQHSTGIHGRTDTTDVEVPDDGEGKESETEIDTEVIDTQVSIPGVNTREHIVTRLREFINEPLAAEEFWDAAAVQQLVLMVLDRGIPGQPLDDLEFHNLLQDVVTGLDMHFRRANQHSWSRMAVVFSRYVAEFET